MPTKLKEAELKFWLGFNQINTIGPIRLEKMLKTFGSLSRAWQADFPTLIQEGFPAKIAQDIIDQKKNINPDNELEKLERSGADIITILDDDYPKILMEIYAPPPLLYYLGNICNYDFSLAVVGSRKTTEYGRMATINLVSQLAANGLTIVSGLALGVDTLAHQTALECRAKTIAVLGSGINQIYPSTNRKLAEKIIEQNGLIVSEFPLNTPPLKFNFPRRNRIISGLSLGTLVTEAKENSGALITARYALEQNREIFAVPGDIFQKNCQGPNNLIQMGAKLVTKATDILEVLNLTQIQEKITVQNIIPATEMEKKILEIISREPIHVDKIVQYARLNISAVNATLTIMEMKGMIKHLGEQRYIKSR